MIRYILKRIILLIPVIIAVSLLVFVLMELAPGSPIDAILANLDGATAEDIAALEVRFGLDKPMLVRYGIYMLKLVQGDLGYSDSTGISVWDTYINRLPNTLAIAFGGLFVAAGISIPMGIRAARRAGKITDNITTTITMVGMSMPSFWLAIMMIFLFSHRLGWLPAGDARQGFRSFIMPAVCSGLMLMATSTRQTRSSMLEVLNADFLRTARAKGMPEKAVIRKHTLGNAWIPIMTNMGMGLSVMLAGSAVIEAVFTWPGVGRMVVDAVTARDVKMVTGAVIMTSVLYVFINLLVDVAYAFVDPRIKAQYASTGRKKKAAIFKHTTVNVPLTHVQEPLIAEIPEPIKQPEPVNITANEEENTTQTLSAFSEAEKAEKTSVFEIEEAEENTSTDNATEAFESVIQKYRKRSRIGEIFHHISKNRGAMAGLIIIAAILLTLLISLIFVSYASVTAPNVQMRLTPPGRTSLFGTDGMGRNQFLRVIYGTRYSLLIGLCGTGIASLVGITLGVLAGYYGKIADEIIMRFSDILASIPGILLGMVIVTVLGPSVPNLILAVGVPAIPLYIRITRASVLTVRGNEFVEASHAIGLNNFRIIFTQILPNGLAPIIVTFTNTLGVMIIVGSSLSFLGFGVPIPHPEWGTMIAEGRMLMRSAPWLTTFPGLFIMITVLAFNLLGDGLRDALDPKLKR